MTTRLVRTAGGLDSAGWIRALDDRAWEHPQHALKLDPQTGAAVYGSSVMGVDVVIKVWALRTGAQRLKAAVRLSRALRHWRGARWLAASGIPTAEPLIVARQSAPEQRELLVMRRLAGDSLLRHMQRVRDAAADALPVRAQHRLALQAGGLAGELAARRALNRDHKPSNLIVTAASADHAELAIIDCVDIRRAPRAILAHPVRMLADMMIEPTGVGVAPRRTLRMRAVLAYVAVVWGDLPRERARRERAAVWRAVEAIVAAHADPKPRVDPLGG